MIFIGQKNEGNTRLSLYNPVKLQRYKQLYIYFTSFRVNESEVYL